MKSFIIITNKLKTKIIFFFLCFFFFSYVVTSSTITESEICTNSEDYINSFFSETEQYLSQEYLNFTPNKLFRTKNDFILNTFFLNEEAINTYQKKRLNKLNIFKIIFITILLISIAIIFNFNFHFICRLHEDEENSENYVGNFMTTFKISSFAWVKYLIYDKNRMNEFYIQYKKHELPKTNKSLKILFLFISFVLLIFSMTIALYNNIKSDETTKATFNISCALKKFLYEIKNGKNDFIGLDIINELFSEFELTNEQNGQIIQKFNENFNEVKELTNDWDNYIKNLNGILSNKSSGEFFISSYPSEIICKNESISTCPKKLYQFKKIYDYYPSNDNNKKLYQINYFMHENIDEIYKITTQFNVINKNILNSNSKNNENIYNNIISKSNKLLNIYIDKFDQIYLPYIHNYFIYNILPFLFNIDFAYVVLLSFCCLLFIPLVLYSFNKKCMETKFLIIILFYNSLFILLILTALSCIKIITIKSRAVFVEDISSVVYFLFDADNLDYLTEYSNFTINHIDLNIKDENQNSKNIFYYLNYIINNNKKINELFEINLTKINRKDINNLYNELKKVFNNGAHNILNNKIKNINLEILSEEFLKMSKEGLKFNTIFKDISDTDRSGQGTENPNNYFSNINKRTQANKRKKSSVEDFDCDESWNISTNQIDNYFYINRKNTIDCDKCDNHFFYINSLAKPALLNYLEYNLNEIIMRYDDLKEKLPNVYYEIINQFIALENFRSNNALKQIEKLYKYNGDLINLQNNIFENLNQSAHLSNIIINSYENLFIKYSINDNYSFLNCDFIKNRINFILYEIEKSFLKTINKYFFIHLLGNITQILLSIILIIFYSLVSYEIPIPKKKSIQKMTRSTIIREINKQKYDDHNRSGDILNGIAFANSKIDGDVSIIKGGTTVNNNNLNAKYYTVFCRNNNNSDLNRENLLNLNKKVEKEINSLNIIASQNTNKSPSQRIREMRNEIVLENNGTNNAHIISMDNKNVIDNLSLK